MATYGTTNQYIKYSVNHQVISQDVAKNQSVVRVWVDIWRTNTGYTTYGSGTVTVTCAGQTASASITPSQRITSTPIRLITHDFTVTHDGNGAKTAYISGQISHAVFSSSTNGYNASLPTIPRAAEITSFTCSSDYLDGTFSVSYSSKATFNYYLRLSIPNVIAVRRLSLGSQTAGNKTASASFSTEELETVYGYTKTASVQRIGAVIETYSGSTKVGESAELMLDLKIPESIKPTIGSVSTSVVDGFEGILLQGKSRLSFSVSGAAGSHGSTIASYSVKGGDFVYSGTSNTCETGVITQSGEIDYLVTVTDSRGRATSETVTVEVAAYSRPSLTAEVYRSTSDGTKEFANGRYITVIPTFSASDVEGNSITSKSIRINNVLKSSSFSSAQKQTYGTYSLNAEYEVVVSVTDAVGNTTTVSTVIGIAKIPMNIPPHKNGIGFGRYCSKEGEAQFGYDAMFEKDLYFSDDSELYAAGALFLQFLSNGCPVFVNPVGLANEAWLQGQSASGTLTDILRMNSDDQVELNWTSGGLKGRVRKLLWSGAISAGGSVTVPEAPYYNLFGVSVGSTSTELWGNMLIGGRSGPNSSTDEFHAIAGLDNGTASYFYKASFNITNGTTLTLQGASRHRLDSNANVGIALYVREIYGIL